LSQEQVLKTLATLGFDEVDAQIYIYLAKKDAQKAFDLCTALKLTRQQFYPSIKRLQSKGIVNSTMEHPARFSAIPFEKVLDTFIKAKIEETKKLQQSKAEILSNWQSLKLEDKTSAKFTVIEGRAFIFSKIQQMIQETSRQVLAIATVPSLAQADQRGIFDRCYLRSLKPKIRFRFLTELSQQNVHVMKAILQETAKASFNIEVRNPDLGLTLFPQMFVRDEREALFFVRARTETSMIDPDDVCLWTDCKTLVQAFTAIFEELWRNSTDAQETITEIETGKLTPRTVMIEDAETAKKKYDEAINSAKEEILISTSSGELVEFYKKTPQLNAWIGKGVSVRIMAPIVNENLKAAKELSKLCTVKHAPPKDVQTTIIDGKHLFQFKTSPQRKGILDSLPDFKKVFYTNNLGYVQKTKAMLDEQWKNASEPSAENLESLSPDICCVALYWGAIRGPGPYGKFYSLPPDSAEKEDYPEIVDEDPSRRLTEQNIIDEIMNAQKKPPLSHTWKFYHIQSIAIIHPPAFFNLPLMLIRAHHIEKHSTFGDYDVIIISLWLETSNGYAYVPVAVLVNRPQAKPFWEKMFATTPAGQNVQMADKEEIEVRAHGNTLFAGWTVPIPLHLSKYILPPACLLIEGYGRVKTESYSIVKPQGVKCTVRQNSLDAFVTFLHPESKYSGPGTHGLLIREFVAEMPPEFFTAQPTLETYGKITVKNQP
jgi:sugar-specific transcriptional regulator TrmB